MKKRISFFAAGVFLFLLAALLLTNCSKDESFIQSQEENLLTQNLDIPVIPAEVALYMTEAEKAAFYAGPPSYTPSPANGTTATGEREKKETKRPKKWRPFFAFGEVGGSWYPVLENCNYPPLANVCYQPGDCPDPSAWIGYFVPWAGEATMTGYGKVNLTYDSYACGQTPVDQAWGNGTYEKDDNILHWCAYWPPNEPPYTIEIIDEDTWSVTWKISICNASNPNPLCWGYSTGDFEDSEGDGTITYRWTGNTSSFYPNFFAPLNPAQITAWGWLYY